MVNNDKNNELTGTIIQMAKGELQKGNVVGMYLNSFTESSGKKIELVSVVDQITEKWESLWNDRCYQRMGATRVHNIKIFPSVIPASQFSKICMHTRERVLAQELKNAYIIYDGRSKWEEGNKFLEDLREAFLKDEDLPFFKNRLEISPKLIKIIRQGLITDKRVRPLFTEEDIMAEYKQKLMSKK